MIQALIQEKGLAHCACLVVVREKLFFWELCRAVLGAFGNILQNFQKK